MSEKYQRVDVNQQASRTIEQFTPLIMRYTYKFQQRAAGLNASIEADDIRQELSLIFHKCCLSYDETKGGSFMNFVITAWFNEMNRLFEKDQRNRDVASTVRADVVGDDEDGFSLFDYADSGCASPEENVEALSSIEYALQNLSDPARLLVETLINPSDAICRQFEMQQRGVRSRQSLGESHRKSSSNLNLRFLFRLFGISVSASRRLQAEIEHKVGSAFGVEYQS